MQHGIAVFHGSAYAVRVPDISREYFELAFNVFSAPV
jgi:hypothetical protein